MNRSKRSLVRPFSMSAAIALGSFLFAAEPAWAQFFIPPDRSAVVYVGPQRPLVFQGTFSVNPVVVSGNRYVRVGTSFSAIVSKPMSGYPGTGFVKPWTAGERARASNFPGSPNYNPNPIITGPWRQWW